MTIKKYVSGPLVYFSSGSIPDYIPEGIRRSLNDTFHAWGDSVKILGQIIDETLTVLSISIDGRQAGATEMGYLCDKMDIPLAQIWK